MGENPGDALRRWKTYRPIIGLEKGATNTCGQRGTYCDPGRGTGRGPAREKQKPGSCRQRGDLNGVAEVLQTHDEASGVDGFGPLVEVVRAEIAIELTADQHVVDAGQDRGGERAERLFARTKPGEASVHWSLRTTSIQRPGLRVRVSKEIVFELEAGLDRARRIASGP